MTTITSTITLLLPSFNPYDVSSETSIYYPTVNLSLTKKYKCTSNLEVAFQWRVQLYPYLNSKNITLLVLTKKPISFCSLIPMYIPSTAPCVNIINIHTTVPQLKIKQIYQHNRVWPLESFQLQMEFSFPFLRANDLRSSLLNIRARIFLLSCT